MKCADILLILEDYTYGELSNTDSIAVAAHLRDCNNCLKQYEITLKENEIFADYSIYSASSTDLEVNSSLWSNIQEQISLAQESNTHTNTKNFLETQKLSIIRLQPLSFTPLETQPLWKRLTNTLLAVTKDFLDNPTLFFHRLLQEDKVLARDKNYWRTGKSAATFLWLFSLFSYVSVLGGLPLGFQKQEAQEKVVELTPLLFPKELIPTQTNSIPDALTKKNISSLDSKTPKGNVSSLSSSSSTVTAANIPSPPSVAILGDLPNTPLPDLTFGIPNNTSSGVTEGNSQKGENALGSNQAMIGQGNGYGSGRSSGNGPMILEDDLIYNANDIGIIPVRILSKEKPRYTEEARQEGVEGKVILSVIFNKNGALTNIQVIRSLGYGLDEEAIKTASQVKFIPATRNGVNVSVRARLEYTFTLF